MTFLIKEEPPKNVSIGRPKIFAYKIMNFKIFFLGSISSTLYVQLLCAQIP